MVAQHRSALPGVEAMTLLTDHAFPRHSHDGFGIGVMTAGAQRSWSGIGSVESAAGDVITVNPGEMHDGTPVHGARGWRMLYLDPALVAQEVAEAVGDAPEIARPALRDLLVYISSTTAHIFEPFIGPYVASKAAGEALAEAMGLEVSRSGIETVIVVPGAFTSGTEHFAHAHAPADGAVSAQYGDLPAVIPSLGARLDAIDATNGGALDVSAVGEAVRWALALPRGERPARIVVDAQRKGVEDLIALHRDKQAAFLGQLGIGDLMGIPKDKR